MRATLLTALLLAAPRVALACPVCFGQNDSPMAAAANLAIVVMLVIVGGVLTAFGSFFIYLRRRARIAAADAGPAGPYPANHGQQAPSPHEGTAQC